MRNRDILLLGLGFTATFLVGLGALTFDVRSAPERQPQVTVREVEWGSDVPEGRHTEVRYGWIPGPVPQAGDEAVLSEWAEAESSVAAAGEAGIWSRPAEFADPE